MATPHFDGYSSVLGLRNYLHIGLHADDRN
jgi:hypothetical protein